MPKPRVLSADQRERVIQHLKDLLQAHREVLVAILHGSFVTGGAFRDVDVALLVDGVPRERFRDYELEQGVRWSKELGLPIDVRLLNDAPIAFRYHAIKGLPLLVREEDCYDELRARTWNEYWDFAPFARRYLKEAIGG
jgi:hypothetical protein